MSRQKNIPAHPDQGAVPIQANGQPQTIDYEALPDTPETLAVCVRRYMAGSLDAARALRAIRDRRLHKHAGYTTFEAFCSCVLRKTPQWVTQEVGWLRTVELLAERLNKDSEQVATTLSKESADQLTGLIEYPEDYVTAYQEALARATRELKQGATVRISARIAQLAVEEQKVYMDHRRDLVGVLGDQELTLAESRALRSLPEGVSMAEVVKEVRGEDLARRVVDLIRAHRAANARQTEEEADMALLAPFASDNAMSRSENPTPAAGSPGAHARAVDVLVQREYQGDCEPCLATLERAVELLESWANDPPAWWTEEQERVMAVLSRLTEAAHRLSQE